jgi:hypothetical protein
VCGVVGVRAGRFGERREGSAAARDEASALDEGTSGACPPPSTEATCVVAVVC